MSCADVSGCSDVFSSVLPPASLSLSISLSLAISLSGYLSEQSKTKDRATLVIFSSVSHGEQFAKNEYWSHETLLAAVIHKHTDGNNLEGQSVIFSQCHVTLMQSHVKPNENRVFSAKSAANQVARSKKCHSKLHNVENRLR